MAKLLAAATFAFALLAAPMAFADEKTVTLDVANMICPACPYIVRGSLLALPGVSGVEISLESKTAIVTYDDAKVAVPALIAATTNAGYPSEPRS